MRRRLLKIAGVMLGALIVLVVSFFLYVRYVGQTDPPTPVSTAALDLEVVQPDSGLFKIGNNWFRKSESGLYELYVEGSAFERGVVNGKLTRELVQYQEEVFNEQINTLVPSGAYRNMLKYFIGYFNRNLDEHVPEEYKLEIYGVSQAASHDFDNIAPAYQRILNYHAAHDIGHALQNMSLVGCTSFATWDDASEDGSLIIGRNFDFYVGDDFARDKIIAFYKPDKGLRFMMVTFGGMTGVLSGMNENGLTVTINAAKCDIPGSAATPVSLVAREILQYASNIDEAYEIAEKRKMFVAESFLIGSAIDGKAVIIEKSPDAIDLYQSSGNTLISTNHFQSAGLGNTDINKEHMRTSASVYRSERVAELLQEVKVNSVESTARILRDQRGKGNAEIGMGNEKLINQLVAHHGIIFQPEKKLVWISTAPWQLGKFVCYDLNKVFALDMESNIEIADIDKTIPADPFLNSADHYNYQKFSKYRFPFHSREDLKADSVVTWNPRSYHAYMLAGDRAFEDKQFSNAKRFYERGLSLEVATLQEKQHMEKQIAECIKKLK